MATFNGKQGVWRTVGGRRIFIKEGQDLETAMKESGKFKKEAEKSIEDIVSNTQPNDTKYIYFDYDSDNDKITLYAYRTENTRYYSGEDDLDEKVIVKMERWAKKIASQMKKNKPNSNGEKIAKHIQDELAYDWFSGMSLFDDGFEFTIYLDE